MLRDPQLAMATAGIAFLFLLGVLGPLAWPRDPFEIDVLGSLAPPSWQHPMGTDNVGRDVLARFNAGAQISLTVGAIVMLAGALIGGFLGLLGGFVGGWVDAVIMRVMDAILAFPPIIFAMAVTVGLGAGLTTASIGITITAIPWYARLVRSEVLRTKAEQFVEAATALGVPRLRLMLRHVAPHTMTTVFIQSAAVFGYAILTLAGLGFVGLGAQIPTPEWGAMITDGLAYALTGQWWLGVFPGFGVLIAVTAANVIADRARDLTDPHGDTGRSG
jgi:peptide/nickel transport system permease protein